MGHPRPGSRHGWPTRYDSSRRGRAHALAQWWSPFVRWRAGTSRPSSNIAWSGETRRSRWGNHRRAIRRGTEPEVFWHSPQGNDRRSCGGRSRRPGDARRQRADQVPDGECFDLGFARWRADTGSHAIAGEADGFHRRRPYCPASYPFRGPSRPGTESSRAAGRIVRIRIARHLEVHGARTGDLEAEFAPLPVETVTVSNSVETVSLSNAMNGR